MTKRIRLADVLDAFETGKRPRGGAVECGVPSLGGEHVTREGHLMLNPMRYVPKAYFAHMSTGKIAIGDVLVVKDGATTGRVGIVEEQFPLSEAGINEHLFLLRANRKLLDPRYLYFYLRSEPGQLQVMSDFRGAAQGGITRGIGDKVQVPLPGIEEQRRVVEVLSRAESIMRMRKEAETKAREVIPELFSDVLSTRTRSPTAPLVSLVDQSRGITYGVVQRGKDTPGGIPLLRIGDFVGNEWAPKDVVRVASALSEQYSRTVLQGGEIVVSIRGTIGRTAIAPAEAQGWNVAREVAVVPLLPNVSREFIHAFLQTPEAQQYFSRETRGVAQRGINLEDLRTLPIPTPSSKEVSDYETYVARMRATVTMQARAASVAQSTFESLLAGVFGEDT